MDTLINQVIANLSNAAVGAVIFATAYLSNMLFSIYHNVKQVGKEFSWGLFFDGVQKMIVFSLGAALLCTVITVLPAFANYVGFVIPDEYTSVFNNVIILAVFLLSSSKYVLESYKKMRQIIDGNSTDKPVDATYVNVFSDWGKD
jgi:hypothetical protein